MKCQSLRVASIVLRIQLCRRQRRIFSKAVRPKKFRFVLASDAFSAGTSSASIPGTIALLHKHSVKQFLVVLFAVCYYAVCTHAETERDLCVLIAIVYGPSTVGLLDLVLNSVDG